MITFINRIGYICIDISAHDAPRILTYTYMYIYVHMYPPKEPYTLPKSPAMCAAVCCSMLHRVAMRCAVFGCCSDVFRIAVLQYNNCNMYKCSLQRGLAKHTAVF